MDYLLWFGLVFCATWLWHVTRQQGRQARAIAELAMRMASLQIKYMLSEKANPLRKP